MNPPASSKPGVSRRMFLRGVGVTMALPWLESVPVWGDASTASDPQRFAALFMGCGVNPEHWWAKGDGEAMELSSCLEPLAGVKTKLNVIHGLFNKSATGVGIHPGQTGNILSGAALQRGAELRGGISMDQLLAEHFRDQTEQPSLVLGCEQPTTGYHETNFSMAYSSHISWQNATSPVPMEAYPSLAFDSLFDNRGNRRNQSVLDRVQEEAAALNGKVSTADRGRLDEYLTSVREVEKRAQAARAHKESADQRAKNKTHPAASMKRPDDGLPEDIREHMRLMCDIIAIGFQTDKTRVATLLMCRDISGLFYPFLGVRDAHHGASHSDKSDSYQKITQYYVSQYAYLAEKLNGMQEGEQTVLDNSCLMFVNSMWSGSAHDSSKVPLLLTGGLGGTLQTGRALNYLDKGDSERKLCSLYLDILDRMGVRQDRFGDAEQRLAGL
jgi:hypothetical protein